MRNGGLRWHSSWSREYVHMTKHNLPGEQGRVALARQFSQKERLSHFLLLDLYLCSISCSDSFFLTVLLTSFHANSHAGNVHPVGQVSSVRVWACLLTVCWCNFCCYHKLPSLKFSFEMYLLITTHYPISNFIYLSHSWKSALCTTECSLGSSPMKKFLCPLAQSIYLPCSSPLEICSFLCGKW